MKLRTTLRQVLHFRSIHSELSVSWYEAASREHAGLSGHAVPAGRPKNQMSPRFGAEVLGTPRPPFSVDTKPLPNVKTPRRLGVVPLWIGPQPTAAEPRAYDGMSGRPMDAAEADVAGTVSIWGLATTPRWLPDRFGIESLIYTLRGNIPRPSPARPFVGGRVWNTS